MPGARCTRSLACESKKHTSVVTTGTPKQSDIPCAMVLTAYVVLSPATNSSCHRRPRIKGSSTRSGRLRLRELGTSNGCQDHTVLPYAAPVYAKGFDAPQVPVRRSFSVGGSVVRLARLLIAHELDPPCDHVLAPDAAASTASRAQRP
jgi:hypothetical protein